MTATQDQSPNSEASQASRWAENESAPPAALAGLLVALLVFVNEASFRLADPENFTVDYQVILRLAVCGSCGLYAWKYLSTSLTALDRFPAAWIPLFGLWCAVTVPFAVNVPYAAASCGSLWCVILFAPVALIHLGPKRLLMTVFGSLAAFAVVSYFVYLVVPPLGRTAYMDPNGDIAYRLGGLSHANGLGRQMALMVLAGLCLGGQCRVPWRKLAAGLGLALVTLYFTDSRTSMLAAAAVALLFCLRRTAAGHATGKALLFAAVGAGAVASAVLYLGGFSSDSFLGLISRSGSAQEMYSFTGRTDIWRFALDRIAESPLVGYGCGCSRFPMCHFDAFPITHAHNLALNVAINTGIVGGFIVVATLLVQLRAMFVVPSEFPDMMTVMVLVSGLADVPLFVAVPDAPTLLWILAVLWRPLVESLPAAAKEAGG